MKIQPGSYLSATKNTQGEEIEWQIRSMGYKDLVRAGDHVSVPVARVGMYPEVEISWKIEFTDSKGKNYSTFAGDRHIPHANKLASPAIGQEEEQAKPS